MLPPSLRRSGGGGPLGGGDIVAPQQVLCIPYSHHRYRNDVLVGMVVTITVGMFFGTSHAAHTVEHTLFTGSFPLLMQWRCCARTQT